MNLKLYVWDEAGVLQDYGTGLVCVLAESAEHAWALLEQENHVAAWALRGHDGDEQRFDPREVTTPAAFVRWGSS